MNMTSRRLALVAVAVVAAAVMLIGAGSAGAAVCPRDIKGQGSSLQKIGQAEWIALYTCTEGRRVTYNATGSGAGLASWRANTGTGSITEGEADNFIGTDDAPSAAQVTNMKRAANETPVTVLPVLQAAVSVIIKPLTGCRTVTTILNVNLEAIWKNRYRNWEEVPGIPAECRGAITRVVRQDVSGTTYQFKHYLWLILREAVFEGKSWLTLQTEENLDWPGTVTRPTERGGGPVVRKVEETESSIGYANYADAAAAAAEGRLVILQVQNNGLGTSGATFASPQEGRGANCLNTVYRDRLGEGASITPELATNYTAIYGSDPNISGNTTHTTAYPICTLTWDVLVLDYARARFTTEIGTSVRNYFEFIMSEAAQTLLLGKKYAPIPSAWRTTVARIISEVR